jgi:hypothetical protein
MAVKVLPKVELKRVIRKFIQDKDRGISLDLFCEICGISQVRLRDVFLNETEPITEYMQRRVNKAYYAWLNGEIAIMQNRDRTKFVQYRKEAKPVLERTTGLQVVNGQIKLKLGITNKYDYSDLTLDEQLKRG